MFEKFDPLAETELSEGERQSLVEMLGVLVNSDGWRWFVRHSERIIEARTKAMFAASEDINLMAKLHSARGAAAGIRQMLDFPRNTLDSLMREQENVGQDDERS